MDVQIVAGRDGANTVEDIFRTLGAGQRLNGDVGVGKNTVDRGDDRCDQLFGALEGYGAGEADGKIGEIAIAGAADAHAPDFEHAIHVRNRIGDLGADSGGSGIEQSIDGSPRQPPAHGNDHARDEKAAMGSAKRSQSR